MGPNSSKHPASSADEPLKSRGEDVDAASLHGSRHEAPATKKRPPRQADLTEPARAVTQRRVGSDVIPAGRPQPGSRLGDAPAPGRPSGRRTPRPGLASRLARGRAGLGGVSGGPRQARPPRDTRAAAAPTGAAAGDPPWRPATT